MALTYEESAALMSDIPFRGRVKVSALKYADYIFNEAENTPAHQSRLRWATTTFQNPEMVAVQLQPPVVMDGSVQGSGASISDGDLQNAVENVVNKLI